MMVQGRHLLVLLIVAMVLAVLVQRQVVAVFLDIYKCLTTALPAVEEAEAKWMIHQQVSMKTYHQTTLIKTDSKAVAAWT